MKSKPLLQLQNVWKTYHMGIVTLDVLRGINVDVYPGEFVAIVGPSGSGKCVSGDTQLISEEGVPIEIKQVNEKNKILALDRKTGDVKLFSVSNVYKREVKSVLEIKATSGRKITVTKEHPFFTVNAAGFSEIPAEQLKTGMFVATPRKINLLGSRQYLNSLAKLSEDHSLIISNSPPLVRKVFRELGVSRKDICNKLGFKLNTYDCWLSKNNIPLHHFVKILVASGKNINGYQKDIKLTALSSNLVVDVPLKTSPELLEFYGFLVGDGYLDLAGVRITNTDQELKNRIRYLAKKIFNIEAKMRKERIDCNSRVLRSFFPLVFEVPLKNKSRTVKLPNFVFKCTKEEISAFIRGLFDCDSHVSKTKKEIAITLASESLIKQLVNLFLRYGIVARYSETIKCACNTKQKIKRRYYSLSISGLDNLNLYKKFIGFNSKGKMNRLNQHLLGRSNTNVDVIPCGELIRNIRQDSGIKLSRKSHDLLWPYETLRIHPSRSRLKEIIKIFESNGINAKKIADLINMDVFWDKVASIEEKDQKMDVYDVTVPEANNFVANNFIIHNSTMMNQVGILDTPTKGKIFLDGIDISTFNESKLAQVRGKKIGFVFQQFNLIPTLTALENVILPAIFQNMPEAVRLKRAQDLLTLVGLADRMHHKPTELSGGQQQRVAIARALINNPEIILADEPTGNLDSTAGKQIMNILNKLHHDEKKTIILVTHDLFLTAHAHKIIHLKDGMVERVEIKK